ncbi:MAG TPA: ABC transporter permease subunit [Candidatus Eisenbergiella merdavium]|uniref:ABC transporter permease subunit n=1 Tax=Candidatus Eisenbergiella merdavium TaxID=2838551 RepID=A0A9D2NDR1_9FIRM|nr:ABC transporter permease subunit [Candidatus Eisenbergiella merdavium]
MTRKTRRKIIARWQIYLLLLLPLIYIIIFAYIPMGGLVLAFKKYNVAQGIWGSPWVGFDNFEKFFGSYKFPLIMRNTLTISLYSLAVSFPIPIIFALLLNTMGGKRYKKMIQTITYLPHFISTVVLVGLVFQLLNNRSGIYGSLYTLFTGSTAPNILSEGPLFKHIYVWSGVWQSTGYNAIIYIAALSGVDQSLHEAAEIDGASRFQRLLHIDIPSILPTASIMLILAVGGIMNVGFEKVLLMQNDLNLNYSEVVSTYVYKIGLASGITDFSLSTAIGMFNSVVNFVLLIIANWGSKKLSGNGIF